MARCRRILPLALALFAGLASACAHMRSAGAAGEPLRHGSAGIDPAQAHVALSARATPVPLTESAQGDQTHSAQLHQLRTIHQPPRTEPSSYPPPIAEPPGPSREALSAPPMATISPVSNIQPVADAPLVAALRCFLNKQPAEALSWLERYEKATQELLLVLLPLAARVAEVNLQQLSGAEATVLVSQLETLAVSFRPLAELTIDKMCFCRTTDGFGVYEPLPENHVFRPGELVWVYLEFQNLVSECRDRQFITRLNSTMEIREYQGKTIWRQDIPERFQTDVSQTQRRDYFSNPRFCIPDTIPPGLYTLRIHVKDMSTGRAAERTADFRVTAAPGRPS